MVPFSKIKLITIGILLTLGPMVGIVLVASKFRKKDYPIQKSQIVKELSQAIRSDDYPDAALIKIEDEEVETSIDYTFDNQMQAYLTRLFKRYGPDYGSFVAIDADTGEVIAIVNHSEKKHKFGNLALRSIFPAASVFKVVTATAAIDRRRISSETIIPYNGRNHTLYKNNVYHVKKNKWTRYMSVKEAFARSVNTVFGKLGMFYVGPEALREYANRFGFDHLIGSDLPMEKGQADISPDNEWAIAESASGFTRKTTMSPLHGALIAGAVLNDGIMMEPFVVESIWDKKGKILYRPRPSIASVTMDQISAGELRTMMNETILRGTSRGTFRPFLRSPAYRDIVVGGKTGSLTGNHPRGKCDWFVGYADFGPNKRRIALAALTVHEQYWTVRSAYLARKFIEKYSRLLNQNSRLAGPTHQTIKNSQN